MYSHVVLGGTFDHLHAGHRDLLSLAFAKSKKVTLGLTKASMNTKKEAHLYIQSYAQRKKEIFTFVRNLGREQDLTILPIHDIYGETLHDDTLEAIIVTPHTLNGAQMINQKRKEKNLRELVIESCPLRLDARGGVISSSRIRLGEINRDGYEYENLFSKDIVISPQTKHRLRRPFGKACGANDLRRLRSPLVIVGDISTQYCCYHMIPFQGAYIDGKTKKQDYTLTYPDRYSYQHTKIHNEAGTITSAVATFARENTLRTQNTIYLIEGEEDLLTVACVLLLPYGTRIVYGYPYEPETMRCITVSERTKQKFFAILNN